jgi:hypothetical protein
MAGLNGSQVSPDATHHCQIRRYNMRWSWSHFWVSSAFVPAALLACHTARHVQDQARIIHVMKNQYVYSDCRQYSKSPQIIKEEVKYSLQRAQFLYRGHEYTEEHFDEDSVEKECRGKMIFFFKSTSSPTHDMSWERRTWNAWQGHCFTDADRDQSAVRTVTVASRRDTAHTVPHESVVIKLFIQVYTRSSRFWNADYKQLQTQDLGVEDQRGHLRLGRRIRLGDHNPDTSLYCTG